MLDRKLAAAGEQVETYRESRDNLRQLAAPMRCNICGQTRITGYKCSGCKELAKVLCSFCHYPFGEHRFSYGSKQHKRLWLHPKVFPVYCTPENDPVKQRAISQPAPLLPRTIYEDIIPSVSPIPTPGAADGNF